MSWFMDLTLSRRLERTEGRVGASFIDARRHLVPALGLAWQDFDGVCAVYDGLESPLTQTFGLGLAAPAGTGPAEARPEAMAEAMVETLAQIEAFFERRGAPVMHEVSPLAGVATLALLVDRGYRPIELSTVLVQGLAEVAEPPAGLALRVRACEAADRAAWIDATVAGWSDDPAIAAIIRPIAELSSSNEALVRFLAERDGVPVATASLGIHEGVALLAGASTIPAARGLGAQGLLLVARLAEARRRGCDLAMMVTQPGSTSQRNAERRGFRVAYTRTKWRRPAP